MSGPPKAAPKTGIMNVKKENYPHLYSIVQQLDKEALKISLGGPEYIHSKGWLDIYWPVDEYVFIQHCVDNKFELLYLHNI